MTGVDEGIGPVGPQHRIDAVARESAADEPGQGLLFGEDILGMPADVGFRGQIACSAAGITTVSSTTGAHRSRRAERAHRGRLGQPAPLRLPRHPRAQVIKRSSTPRLAAEHPHRGRAPAHHGVEDLAQVTLMSDARASMSAGARTRSSTSPGRPGRVRNRHRPRLARGRGSLAELPSERIDGSAPSPRPRATSLAARRAARPPLSREPPTRGTLGPRRTPRAEVLSHPAAAPKEQLPVNLSGIPDLRQASLESGTPVPADGASRGSLPR